MLISVDAFQNHFWMMTEYSKQDSWIKIAISFSYMSYMSPVCLSVTGQSLFLADGKVILYNFEDNKYVQLDLDRSHLENDCVLEADMYVESLISPHAYCRNLQDEEQM